MGILNDPSNYGPLAQPYQDDNLVAQFASIRGWQDLSSQQFKVMGNELMILGAIMKEQMTDNQYAETRKRIEAELFPPPPNIDQAAFDSIKEDMESMQKDSNDFRKETQGMLRDLSKVTSETSTYIRELRDREPAPLHPMEDDLDRGTDVSPQSPPDDEEELEPEIPPYICPNCNEEIPNEQKNEHTCKPARTPKKPKKK